MGRGGGLQEVGKGPPQQGVASTGMSIGSIQRSKSLANRLRLRAEAGSVVRARSAFGTVSKYGVDRVKIDAKARPGLASFFSASKGKAYVPMGGAIDLSEKNSAQESREMLAQLRRKTEKTDEERLRESVTVPLDDMIHKVGPLSVRLDPHSSVMMQVRLGDLKSVYVGRKTRLPRTLVIAMTEVSGNPDLWITPAEKLEELGVPCKQHHVWHSHDCIAIGPQDPNYSLATYYIAASSGIDACSFRILARTDQFIPTITSAINRQYRTYIHDQANGIGNTVIRPSINEADDRRKTSKAGNFPMEGFPLPHAVYGKKNDDPTVRPMSAAEIRDHDIFLETASSFMPSPFPSRPASTIKSQERRVTPEASMASCGQDVKRGSSCSSSHLKTSASGQGEDDERKTYTRPRSALERAMDVTFKCTLSKVAADYDLLDIKTVQIKPLGQLMGRRKLSFSHVGGQKRQLEALFGHHEHDLRAHKEESFAEDSTSETIENLPSFPEVSDVPAIVRDHEHAATSEGGVEMFAQVTETVDGWMEESQNRPGGSADVCMTREDVSDRANLDEVEVHKDTPGAEKKVATKRGSFIKRRKGAPPLKNKFEWHPFRADFMALLGQSKAVTRRLADLEYHEIATPVAIITGYAVVQHDGPGRRQVVGQAGSQSQLQIAPPVRVKSGQTMLVEAGMQLPFGADAIVDPKFVFRDTDISSMSNNMHVIIKDLAVVGQNVRMLTRPYYIGGDPKDINRAKGDIACSTDGFMQARDYVMTRYPQLLDDYDSLFKKHFKVEEPEKLRQGNKMNAETLQLHLRSLESCSSPLLHALTMDERRELAEQCKMQVYNEGAPLAREGDCEELQGLDTRQMYILMQGNMVINKRFHHDRPQRSSSPHTDISVEKSSSENGAPQANDEDVSSRLAFERDRIESKEWGRTLGTISAPGSLFGERQLLFGEPWPVSVRGLSSYKMLVIPLCAFSKIILQRPGILDGMGWLDDESKFMSSTNHVDLLLVMGSGHQQTISSPSPSRPTSPKDSERKASVRRNKEDARYLEIKRMLRLESEMVHELHLKSKEKLWDDALVAMGALTEEQLAALSQQRNRERELQIRRWGERPEKRGAMGDVVAGLLKCTASQIRTVNRATAAFGPEGSLSACALATENGADTS